MRYVPLLAVHGASIVIAAPLWRLMSFYGRKMTFGVALFVMVFGTLLCSRAFTLYGGLWFSVARAISGVGAGGVLRLTMTYISELVSPSRQVYFLTNAWGASLLLSTLFGALITDNLSWRAQFYVAAAAMLILGIVIMISLPKTPITDMMRRERVWRFWLFDWSGGVILLSCVTCFLLAFFHGGQALEWTSGGVIAGIILGCFLIVVFMFVEMYHSYEPLVPIVLFLRSRNYFLACAITFLFGFTFSSVMYYVPLYLQIQNGLSSTQTAFYLWSAILPFCLVSFATPKTSSMSVWYMQFSFLLPILGTVLLSVTGSSNSMGFLVGGCVVFGIGMGAAFQMPITLGVYSIKQVFTLKDDRQHMEIAAPLIYASLLGSTVGVSSIGAAIFTTWVNHVAIASTGSLVALSAFDIGAGDLFDLETISTFADVTQSLLRRTFGESFRIGMIILIVMSALLLLISLLLSPTIPVEAVTTEEGYEKEKDTALGTMTSALTNSDHITQMVVDNDDRVNTSPPVQEMQEAEITELPC
ncbi:hypothetical protein SeLEV6574_g07437 [Synchytrium endobioticum]|uniref:Major facilitator superfamily (MFS) profile domain-containing protein n=1 Tax=Synchytrium endobioticum TaxID=286115 RepID=A0A507CHV6_9FUNG|nr:hypothetical protein SeLEV6574_g07437 [Synchytrium endobioticum]